ncbi:MAG: ATP-binding cassette domain-containing protein [Spirochaetota bacterium]
MKNNKVNIPSELESKNKNINPTAANISEDDSHLIGTEIKNLSYTKFIENADIKHPKGSAIEVHNLNYHPNKERIITDINLTIPIQGCIVFLGASGSGKSTLIKLISGILEPTSGSVIIRGQNINTLFKRDRQKFMNHNIAFVFQEGGLINNLSVYQNIIIPLTYYGKFTNEEVEKIADETLSKFKIQNLKDKFPGKLTYGQKKYIGIARAFSLKPNILFLDEPTTNLDMETTDKVISMIRNFIILGGTVVSATSDMLFANSVSSMLGIIDKGIIMEYGSPTKVKLSQNFITKKVIKNIYKEADIADEILKLMSTV